MDIENQLKSVYREMMIDAVSRLKRTNERLDSKTSAYDLEEAALHLRKALESIAFAAVAPNKNEYAKFRASADQSADYTKDFHASRILQALSHINPDFFPLALSAPIRSADGKWHFEQRTADSMSRNQFEKIYDQLGRLLHAQNPWRERPDAKSLQQNMAAAVRRAEVLIERHAAFIRAPDFSGCWLVEKLTSGAFEIRTAEAKGEFQVKCG